mgnify:FL=1
MSVFLNLSNHSSRQWGNKQRAESEKYGKIVDIGFPPVPADASAQAVKKIAKRTFEVICQYDCSVANLLLFNSGNIR